MKNFILLLHENVEQIKNLSPEEMENLIGSHMKYRDELEKAGQFVAGSGLDEDGRLITGKESIVKDGPYIESKELMGGYYVIKAKDYASAVEIAKKCPNHHWGGTTEVRYLMTEEDYAM